VILSVRAAGVEDAVEITECLAELGYHTTVAAVAANLAGTVACQTGAVLVATDSMDGRVLGVASVHLIPLFHASGYLARLTSLAIRHTAQRQGVGTSLIEAVTAYARQAQCRRLEVTSGDHRPEAHEFYLTRGFHVDERRFLKVL
jgi:GNAT superfamily N-acetyltransferase